MAGRTSRIVLTSFDCSSKAVKIEGYKFLKFLAEFLYCTLYVTDLMNRIVQILRRDLRQVRISAQEAELMEPVKP